MISIEMTSGECNEQGGYDAAQYLDEKLYSKTNFNYTKKRTYGVLDGIIGAYCSSSRFILCLLFLDHSMIIISCCAVSVHLNIVTSQLSR